jgi:hypothetical protein
MAILPISSQYKYTSRGPLDAKSLVKTYDELLSLDTWTLDDALVAYNGMITAVWLNKTDTSKNGIYFLFDTAVTTALKKPDVTNEANWHKLAELSDISNFTERLSAIEKDLQDLDVRVTALEKDSDVITYGYRSGFPTTGEQNKLYVAADENKTYIWFNDEYVTVGGSSYEEPAVIHGGNA